MNISDLNHIEAVEGSEVVGGHSYYDDYTTYYQNDKVKFNVKTKIDLQGNSAIAFADSNAYGYNKFTKTQTNASADYYSANSSSASFAATDGGFYYY